METDIRMSTIIRLDIYGEAFIKQPKNKWIMLSISDIFNSRLLNLINPLYSFSNYLWVNIAYI